MMSSKVWSQPRSKASKTPHSWTTTFNTRLAIEDRNVNLQGCPRRHPLYHLDPVSWLLSEAHACYEADCERLSTAHMKCCAQQSLHNEQHLYRNCKYTPNRKSAARDPWISSVSGLK
jgi:hypothetical protein